MFHRAWLLAAALVVGAASQAHAQLIADGSKAAAVEPPDSPPPATDALPPRLRIANEESTARARQWIEYGDARFRQQEISEAYQRYRKAAEAAPNLAEAYFRQAFAQAALERYSQAVKSIRRGLTLEPAWAKSRFALDNLYADNLAAKRAHFERLATAAANEPQNADLMFLLGIEMFFDHQPARARAFLRQSISLGIDRATAQSFLDLSTRQLHRTPRGEEL